MNGGNKQTYFLLSHFTMHQKLTNLLPLFEQEFFSSSQLVEVDSPNNLNISQQENTGQSQIEDHVREVKYLQQH